MSVDQVCKIFLLGLQMFGLAILKTESWNHESSRNQIAHLEGF